MSLSSSIKTKAIDAGQNFLTGQITSAFAANGLEVAGGTIYDIADNIQKQAADVIGELENGAMLTVSSVGAGLGSTFGNVIGTGMSLAGDVTQISDMAQEAIAEVTSYSLGLLSKKTSEIASTVTSYFTSRVTYWAGQELKQALADIPKKFLIDKETESNINALKEKVNGPQKILKYVNTYVGLATTYINKYTSYMNNYVNDVCKYAMQGPQWIGGQINKLENEYKNLAYDFIDDQAETIMDNRNKFLDGIAKGIAKQTVKPTIKALDKKIDKLNNMTNKNTAKVKQAAATQIQKAKFKLAGLLGISPL